MRILILSDLWVPFPGGAERLIFNIGRDLMQRGEEVHVLVSYHAAQQFDGPPIRHESIGVFDRRDAGWEVIQREIEETKPDVIITHHLFAFQFEVGLASTGIPIVQLVLNGHRLMHASLAVYISEHIFKQARGWPKANDMVITPPALDDCIADKHGDKIGFIKPIAHKGISLLYQLAELDTRRKFLVLRGEWRELEDIRPADNIQFMDPVTDIRDFYRECRLVLMPSLTEDAGTVAQECTLNNIPCLASNVGGLAETACHLLPPQDLGRWQAAVSLLDDPVEYDCAVAEQHVHLAGLDHAGKLELLHQKIKGLL